MSEYRQPWNRVEIGRRRVRLQILDPQTAFEFEGRIVQALGDTLALLVSSPDQVTGAVIRQATGAKGLDTIMTDPVRGPEVAGMVLHSTAEVLAGAIASAEFSPKFVSAMFRRMVVGKLEVRGELVHDMRDYQRVGFRALDKWRLLGAQVKQSYGPLWTRSPYRLKSKREDYGVPRPKGVPVAVAWADALAVRGSASSSHEILTSWTPVRMIEVVEVSAQQAEIVHRMQAAARRGSG